MTINENQLHMLQDELVARGWGHVPEDEIIEFHGTGSVPESSIGEDYDQAKAAAFEAVFDDAGIEVGAA